MSLQRFPRWTRKLGVIASLLGPALAPHLATAQADTLSSLEPMASFVSSYLGLEAELLSIREAAGEIDAAGRARALAAATEELRQARADDHLLADLRDRRREAAERLLAAVEARLSRAQWPSDRSAAEYEGLARQVLESARQRLATTAGGEPDGGLALRPVAAALGWTRGRTDGTRPFDGLDAEVEAAVRAFFAGLPHSSLLARAPQAPPSGPSRPPAPGSPAPSPSSSHALAMSKGQQILALSHAECLSGAAAALRTSGYTSWGDSGNGSWGERQNQGAVILCEVTVGEREVVDILVATEGTDDPAVPGAERVRLQGLMKRTASSAAATRVAAGCQGATYSVAVTPAVARQGQEITIRFASQGEMHDYDWIGIYPVGQGARNKIDWVYTTTHEYTCSWTRIAPPPGEWEIAYLLDDSYDEIRARTRLTVLASP
jgi:hypothetical protein